jgi:hypothetical protein
MTSSHHHLRTINRYSPVDVIQDMKKVLGGERYLNLFILKMCQARG